MGMGGMGGMGMGPPGGLGGMGGMGGMGQSLRKKVSPILANRLANSLTKIQINLKSIR